MSSESLLVANKNDGHDGAKEDQRVLREFLCTVGLEESVVQLN